MNLLPSNSSLFIGATANLILKGKAAILGCGYDGTTSFRPGTRRGPDGLRGVSDAGIETYSPAQDRDLEEIQFTDLGNLDLPCGAPEPVIEDLYQATREILAKDAIPAIIGGEHSISPGPILAAFEKYPDLAVVQFDAHADLREEWNGNRNSHACAMRRVLDFLSQDRLLQVGIRSGTREEFAEMKKGTRLVAANASSFAAAMKSKQLRGAPLYLTFDLDLFDPSLVSGTGTPEPGGISWQTFEELRDVLEGENIIGFDIVELAPTLDPSENSSVVAAKLMRELLLTLPTR
ncbi:MAG: agmatinase [Akkermansiaceae bacterium]|nr:agmatinase [Akkermansiaceae bacterium]